MTNSDARPLALVTGASSGIGFELAKQATRQRDSAAGHYFFTDPEEVEKVTYIVGLYLAPSENAVVTCLNENSRIGPGTGPDRAEAI